MLNYEGGIYLKSTLLIPKLGEWQDLILIVAFSVQDKNQMVPDVVETMASLHNSS